MRRPRIALDMDEVLADVMPSFVKLYEQRFGRTLRQSDYWGQKIYDLPGAADLRNHLYDEGFFAALPVLPHSQEVVRELMEHYDIFITTAAMEFRNSLNEKYDWLREHFPFLPWKNFVFCGDKSIIRADYMIDDHVRNLEQFTGTGVLFTATHNIHEQRFVRVDNWLEVRDFFAAERAGQSPS